MVYLSAISVLILSYLIGSIPIGLLAVKLHTGKDIRKICSDRTGTTNALRVAGSTIAIVTLLLDELKGASAVWLARKLLPMEKARIVVFCQLFAIFGHNYSII